MGHRNLAPYPLILQHLFQPRKVMRTVSEELLSFKSLNMLHSAVMLDCKNRTRASSQQSSSATTHSARFGGHIVCISLRYSSGPAQNTDSLGVIRECRDMTNVPAMRPLPRAYSTDHIISARIRIYLSAGAHMYNNLNKCRVAYPLRFISSVLWIISRHVLVRFWGRYIYGVRSESWNSSHCRPGNYMMCYVISKNGLVTLSPANQQP